MEPNQRVIIYILRARVCVTRANDGILTVSPNTGVDYTRDRAHDVKYIREEKEKNKYVFNRFVKRRKNLFVCCREVYHVLIKSVF